jgi:methyltransferase
VTPSVFLLCAVTAGRLAELLLARRNTRELIAKGAFEVAPGHYSFIVALHASWLLGLWTFGWNQNIRPFWLAVFLALQALRIWVLTTLAERWTTRIIIVPGETLASTGPYRLIPHPNYAVVCGEVAVLPLCLGLPWLALIFSTANAMILSVRIRAENAALKGENRAAHSSLTQR